jgi:rhodanese-related sulfurtransferase
MSLACGIKLSDRWRQDVRGAALILIFAAFAAVGHGWWSPLASHSEQDPRYLRVEQALNLVGIAVFVDARSQAEFEQGHVTGAVHLTEASWEHQIESFLGVWTPGQPVVVYCSGGGCRASHGVADRLTEELGLSSVSIVREGWQGMRPHLPEPLH